MNQETVCYAESTPREALVWSTVAFFSGLAGVSAFGPIAPKLKDAVDAGPFLMSILAASPALTGSLLRIPFGALVDRMGAKKLILILLVLSAVGLSVVMLMFSRTVPAGPGDYPIFLLAGILCGCGVAIFSVGIPAVSYWFPQRRQGTSLAIYAGLGNLSPGLFAFLLPLSVTHLGLTWSYRIWLASLLLLTALVFIRMKDAPYFQYKEMGLSADPEALLACGEELIPSGKAMDSIRKAGGDWRTWILTFFYFISFGGFLALTVWLPTYWTELFHTSLVEAGLLTALFSISTSLLRVIGGMVADRVGGERVAAVSLSIVAAGALVMVLVETSRLTALAGTMVLAVGMGFANAAIFKLVPKFTPKAVGGAAGIIGGLGAFGGFAIPPLMGLFVRMSGLHGYSQGFYVFLALCGFALILFGMLTRSKPAPDTATLSLVK
jgi:NNP family nitrate/nitrite transporter-like MFS transporter